MAMGLCAAHSALALDLDWSGQFRSETHWLYNYTLDGGNTTVDATRNGKGGYYIPGGGSNNAFFQTLFMRLRPTVIVNDNVSVKSEWWVGNPIFGMFGSGAPNTIDQQQYNSSFSQGSFITAQRLWGEFQSDFGTLQVGRMPLNWGLGVVCTSGNNVNDRYFSTEDGIRLQAKFGSFTLAPGLFKVTMGNSVGGACPNPSSATSGTGVCSNSAAGGGGVADLSVALKYDNPDEQMEMGVNFIRRIAGTWQTNLYGVQGNDSTPPTVTHFPSGMNYNTWDIYGRKTMGILTFGAEIPVVTGTVGNAQYKTFAIALEADAKFNPTWEASVKAGHVPGQPDLPTTTVDNFKAFYFHPDYKIGLIMFNYQLANFAGPNNQNSGVASSAQVSPFDNPITNAQYIAVGGGAKVDKWKFHTNWVWAKANEAASNGAMFFNSWERLFRTRTSGSSPQSKSLGWEMDYGVTFNWDDNIHFDWDFGVYFPGDYYKFTNVAGSSNNASTLMANVFRVGLNF